MDSASTHVFVCFPSFTLNVNAGALGQYLYSMVGRRLGVLIKSAVDT